MEQPRLITDERDELDVDLRASLLEGVTVMPAGSWSSAMGDNQGWGEVFTGDDSPTGEPTIAINDEKFTAAGAGPGYRDKMIMFESLHLLKDVDPVRHNRLMQKALKDPDYMNWAERSYARVQVTEGEERSFEDWHSVSRFDQVIGGYMAGGDPDLPSMKDWDRDQLPIGEDLRSELESLRTALRLD